ncbi:MAG TPA: Flp pilus assembly protein CpaB [Chloroflexi bacterium]|nr:Flp pilus assembly protein CpaB [Chloroflexota bacterium]
MGRLRGFLWLTTGMIVAVLAGFVAFVALTRAQAQAIGQDVSQPKVPVVVAAGTITVRSALTADKLEVREMPIEAVPEGAVSKVEDAVGQLTLVDLYPGEVVLAQRLVDPNVTSADGRTAVLVAEDEVLMAFPAQDLMSRVGVLKPGDQVDLLFSLNVPATGNAGGQDEKQATFNLLQNVAISAVVAGQAPRSGNSSSGSDAMAGGAPTAILLTVSAQDALVLKYVKDAGGIVDIVLRAPGMDRPFSTESVDVDYIINRYQIPTQK